MHSLEAAQSNFINTINDGPDVLDPAMFDGPTDRVLLCLSAHANTINHARLVALEETFPLTRQHLGQDTFNQLARNYVETAEARACDSNQIGAGFAEYIANDILVRELAQIEWAWLQSYHAAEASPLTLAELGTLDEVGLLTLPVTLHPSARLVEISEALSLALPDLGGMEPSAILTIRPDEEVRIIPLDAVQMAAFQSAAQKNAVLGNLLGAAIEIAGETASLGPVMDLIGAGALVKAGHRNESDNRTL